MTPITHEILAEHNIVKSMKDGFHTARVKVGKKYFIYWSKKEVKYLEEWQEKFNKLAKA